MCPSDARRDAVEAPLRGARLIAAAAFYFLFPIVAAMLLAVFAGSDPERRSLAALFGLSIGIVLAAAAGRWCTRRLERRARLPEQAPRVDPRVSA